MTRFLLSCIFLSAFSLQAQVTRQTAAAGNWSNPATWQNGVPTTGDNVEINHNVVYDVSNGVYQNFSLSGVALILGQLSINNATLTVDGQVLALTKDIAMNAGGLRIENAGIVRLEANQNTTIDGSVVVDGGFLVLANQPNVSITCNASVVVKRLSALIGLQASGFNLEINDSLVFESGSALIGHSTGAYTVGTGPNAAIVFEHGSQYFQSANITYTGDPNVITWEIDFTPDLLGWRQIASPILGGTMADLEDDFPLYFDNPLQANAYYWDAQPQGNKAKGWAFATSNSDPFDPSQAYSIYAGPPYYPFQDGGKIDLQGSPPPLSNFTYDLYNTSDPLGQGNSAKDRGWNLVPNPYTAALNVTKMVEDPDFPASYKAAHVWDAVRKQYIAILGRGVSNEIDHSSNNAVISQEKYIMPFQAFWVKLNPNDASVATLPIKSEYRTISPVFVNHFKVSSVNFLIPVQAWNVTDSTVDQVTFNIDTAGSASFEPGLDAFKVPSLEANVPSLFTRDQDSLFALSVQTLEVPTTATLPLHFKTNTPGNYGIRLGATIAGMSQIDLVDLKTNQTHDLTSGPYVFTHDPQFGEHRFNLIFGGNSIGTGELATDGPIHFGQNAEQWQLTLDRPGTMKLVDLSGRVLSTEELEAGIHTRSKRSGHVPAGLYLVVVECGNQTATFKLLQ